MGRQEVSATEAAMRGAWQEICMVEYRITGDMQKATAFADRIEGIYRDQVRANVLREVEGRIRDAAKGRAPYGLCPEISTARGAADLVSRMANNS